MQVLPSRTGNRQDGSAWTAQPFIFEYFEHESDRYSDKVLLETFDTSLTPMIQVNATIKCGFGHSVREFNGRKYNELRLYKLEIIEQAPPES